MARQIVHEIDRDVVKIAAGVFEGAQCGACVVDAAYLQQVCVVKRLNADGEAVDAKGADGREVFGRKVVGICLERDFNIVW